MLGCWFGCLRLRLTLGGSLFITRPMLMHYTADPAEGAAEVFALVAADVLKVEICQRFPLSEAAAAHRDLEGRKTTGATVLLPWRRTALAIDPRIWCLAG